MELQQSEQYERYVRSLGWQVISVDGARIFLRSIPLTGVFAKMQRPNHLPFLPKLVTELKRHHVRTIAVEPPETVDPSEYGSYIRSLTLWFTVSRSHFLPTKTILVDTTPPEDTMFARFSQAKRRAVRRAEKNNVHVRVSSDIRDLIRIKSRSAGMFGGITTYGVDRLSRILGETHFRILLAVHDPPGKPEEIVGGVLVIFWNGTALYWIAGATRHGKKLSAPSLLVWEALRLAHKRKATLFDFLGVWDERLPKENKAWLGFTKFKEGFGGTTRYYPIA